MSTRSLFLALSLTISLLYGCNNNNSDDPVNDGQSGPIADPPPAPPDVIPSIWNEVNLTIAREDSQCEFQQFKVNSDGLWNFERCERTESGQLTMSELDGLNSRIEAASERTEVRACPEVLVLDEYYVLLQGPEQSFSYDPDGACYEGGENQVRTLRNYLIRLQNEKI